MRRPTLQVRTPCARLCALLVPVLLAGCASYGPCGPGLWVPWIAWQDRADAKRADARIEAALHAEVPMPSATPFDADPAARGAYLEAYRDGYRSGLLAFRSGHDGGRYLYPRPDVTHHATRVAGWEAGDQAGLAAAPR